MCFLSFKIKQKYTMQNTVFFFNLHELIYDIFQQAH